MTLLIEPPLVGAWKRQFRHLKKHTRGGSVLYGAKSGQSQSGQVCQSQSGQSQSGKSQEGHVDTPHPVLYPNCMHPQMPPTIFPNCTQMSPPCMSTPHTPSCTPTACTPKCHQHVFNCTQMSPPCMSTPPSLSCTPTAGTPNATNTCPQLHLNVTPLHVDTPHPVLYPN